MQLRRRNLLIGFTLLIVMQGEFVLNARTRVIMQSMDGRIPADVYGVCCPVRVSSDSVPVCVYDARLRDGEWVATLTARELAQRGIRPLTEVLDSCVKRQVSLFLDVRPPVVDTLTEEQRAERLLILQRADSVTRRELLPDEAPVCDYELLVERVLSMARDAGMPKRGLWLILHDPALCARYGADRKSDVGICYESADGSCSVEAGALMLHWSRIASKEEIRRMRRHVRRIAVWDVNTPEDAARMCSCKVDYLLTDEPQLVRSLVRK